MKHDEFDRLYDEARRLAVAPLTLESARRVRDIIADLAEDDEVAHALEDKLREATLRTLTDVQEGDGGFAAKLCAIALSSGDA